MKAQLMTDSCENWITVLAHLYRRVNPCAFISKVDVFFVFFSFAAIPPFIMNTLEKRAFLKVSLR